MMKVEDLEGYGKDVMMHRIRHYLMKAGPSGMSSKVLSNRMKLRLQDKDKLFARINRLVDLGIVEIKKTDRVYNGLPVFIYVWKQAIPTPATTPEEF